MTTLLNLESFVGKYGQTTDEEFDSLTCSLEIYASVINETEAQGTYADIVSTEYEDKLTGVQYELWYQVRTPESPEGMEFAYGFRRIPKE